MIADAYIESVVAPLTSLRIDTGLRMGTHKGHWGSLSKLQNSVAAHQATRTILAVLGAEGVIWDGDEVRIDNPGTAWLDARGRTIAGGSNEMQRNIISERLLGLPASRHSTGICHLTRFFAISARTRLISTSSRTDGRRGSFLVVR